MNRTRLLRGLLALNAVVALFGLGTNMANTLIVDNPNLPGLGDKIFDEFSYFTIQVNWLVVAVCIAFVLNPVRTGRVWPRLRFVALVGIAMTGICYYALVAAELNYTGIIAVGDVFAHVISPILYVGTWLVFGPRGQADWVGIAATMGYIALWIGFTLVRGAVSGLYPYGFTDVSENGYVSVLTMAAVLSAFAFLLALAALGYDRLLGRRRAPRPMPRS
jgi:hypothetical protein